MSTFDADTFLSGSVVGDNSTVIIPIPTGKEYMAKIVKLGAREVDIKDEPGRKLLFVDVTFEILDDELKTITKKDKNLVRYGMPIQRDETGAILMGPGVNVELGRLREALDQNRAGTPWSWSMLLDQMAKITIKHRKIEGTDDLASDVKQVIKLS